MKALLRLYYLQSLLHGPRRGVDAEEGHLAGVASAAEPRVTRVARRSIAAAGGLAPHLSCQCLYAHAQTLFSSHFLLALNASAHMTPVSFCSCFRFALFRLARARHACCSLTAKQSMCMRAHALLAWRVACVAHAATRHACVTRVARSCIAHSRQGTSPHLQVSVFVLSYQ